MKFFTFISFYLCSLIQIFKNIIFIIIHRLHHFRCFLAFWTLIIRIFQLIFWLSLIGWWIALKIWALCPRCPSGIGQTSDISISFIDLWFESAALNLLLQNLFCQSFLLHLCLPAPCQQKVLIAITSFAFYRFTANFTFIGLCLLLCITGEHLHATRDWRSNRISALRQTTSEEIIQFLSCQFLGCFIDPWSEIIELYLFILFLLISTFPLLSITFRMRFILHKSSENLWQLDCIRFIRKIVISPFKIAHLPRPPLFKLQVLMITPRHWFNEYILYPNQEHN